ncbi:MAG: hypothetical protein JXA11_00280 [Phycisphaerae bacterium]|nr:hypothetical protein [Phycisphaerae bacterium]
MNIRKRFKAVMNYEPFDRIPVWYFGTWVETRERWKEEGLRELSDLESDTLMDPDWEQGQWKWYGLVNAHPIAEGASEVLEETETYRVFRDAMGKIIKKSTAGSSISQTLKYPLEPTRTSWEKFKTYLDPDTPSRRPDGWRQQAELLGRRTDRVIPLFGGSLFQWLRGWMGIENLSYLPYDDPVLLEEILDYITDYFMELFLPLTEYITFDFCYIFEDCCGKSGPLLSPEVYRKHFDGYYRKIIHAYRKAGINFMLLDSDGRIDALLPLWLDSGIDILFPMEVGTWKADPVRLRREHGKRLRMMGGINKHVIPKGEAAVRAELERLVPVVEEGGYIPLPDHRIPPDCSLDQFKEYIRIFRDVFNINSQTALSMRDRNDGLISSGNSITDGFT